MASYVRDAYSMTVFAEIGKHAVKFDGINFTA